MWPLIFFFLAVVAELEWECPYSWKIDRSTNLCFKVFREDVFTNSAAESVCSFHNYTLGVISSNETLLVVEDIFEGGWRIPQIEFPADRVWISSNSGLFSEPSEHSDNSSRCTSFLPTRTGKAAHLESIDCDFSHQDTPVQHVLCQTEWATKTEVLLHCPEGWSLFKGRGVCHKLFKVGISSIDGAKSFCRAHSANVSMLLSEQEKDFVEDLMTSGWIVEIQDFPLNQVWVGAKKTPFIREFYWSNGNILKDNMFFIDEPNGAFEVEPCITMNPINMDKRGRKGALADISCDHWKYYDGNIDDIVNHVLCEQPASDKKEEIPTNPIPAESCAGDWDMFDDRKCHKLYQIGVTTMNGAQKICEAKGGRLSSIETRDEVQFVTELMKRGWKISGNDTFYNHVWVSLRRDKETRKWMWNGKKTLGRKLGKVQQNSFGDSDCAAYQPLKYIEEKSDFFGEVPCDTAAVGAPYPPSHILCERDYDASLPVRRVVSSECPKHWNFYSDESICFKIFTENTNSFQEAQQKCASQGANLVSISTSKKRKFVTELATSGWRPRLTSTSESAMWIGLKKNGSTWNWLNGAFYAATDSSSNALDDPKNCGVMYPTRMNKDLFYGLIEFEDCDQPIIHFVCEKVPPKPVGPIYIILGIILAIVLIIITMFVIWTIFRCKRRSRLPKFDNKTSKSYALEKLLDSDIPLFSLSSSSSSADSSVEIPKKNVELVEKIGEGFFGVVWSAKLYDLNDIHSYTDVAVKNVHYSNDIDQCESLTSEIKYLSKIGAHPNVIKFIGATISENSRNRNMLIMEYCPRGNLRNHLLSIRDNSYMNETNLNKFALEIACGMEYISSIPFIHRDLAARNVLLTEDYVCKITDFGLAKNENYYKGSPSCGLPFCWMSPEAIESKRFTEKSDVWSFGIVLFEIFSYGSIPYFEINPRDVISEIVSGRINKVPERTPKKIAALIHRCWEFDPQNRPYFTECVSIIKDSIASEEDPVLHEYLNTAKI